MIWSGLNHYCGILLKYYNYLHSCSIKYGCKTFCVFFFFLHHAINGQDAIVEFV